MKQSRKDKKKNDRQSILNKRWNMLHCVWVVWGSIYIWVSISEENISRPEMRRNPEHHLSENIANNKWDQYPLIPREFPSDWNAVIDILIRNSPREALSDSTFFSLSPSGGQLKWQWVWGAIIFNQGSLCVVTSGHCCLLTCRAQFSESLSWWKRLGIKSDLSYMQR